MASPGQNQLELQCPKCGWLTACSPRVMAEWLRKSKMLRGENAPDLDVLVELFKSSSHKFFCPQCQQRGLLALAPREEAEEDWGGARPCDACGKPIPAERLEVFPETRLCVNCQNGDERGRPVDAPQYCPKCGNLMIVRQSRGAGIARYVMACTKCRG